MILYENETIVINTLGIGVLIMMIGIMINIVTSLFQIDINSVTFIIIGIGYVVAMYGLMNPLD